MALIVVDTVLARLYISALEDLLAGRRTVSSVIEFEDRLVPLGLLMLAVNLAAVVCVITWLYRAAQNAELINPGRCNNTPKWAIWGWFVPFMNLVRPFHMVKETWEASQRGDTTPTPMGLIRWCQPSSPRRADRARPRSATQRSTCRCRHRPGEPAAVRWGRTNRPRRSLPLEW